MKRMIAMCLVLWGIGWVHAFGSGEVIDFRRWKPAACPGSIEGGIAFAPKIIEMDPVNGDFLFESYASFYRCRKLTEGKNQQPITGKGFAWYKAGSRAEMHAPLHGVFSLMETVRFDFPEWSDSALRDLLTGIYHAGGYRGVEWMVKSRNRFQLLTSLNLHLDAEYMGDGDGPETASAARGRLHMNIRDLVHGTYDSRIRRDFESGLPVIVGEIVTFGAGGGIGRIAYKVNFRLQKTSGGLLKADLLDFGKTR